MVQSSAIWDWVFLLLQTVVAKEDIYLFFLAVVFLMNTFINMLVLISGDSVAILNDLTVY